MAFDVQLVTVTRFYPNPITLPARIHDGLPSRLDCPFCENWQDTIVREYDPLADTFDDVVRKLFCEGCGGRITLALTTEA